MVSRLRLSMLGPPAMDGAEGPIRLRTAKGLALLCYLAARPGRSVTRSEIAGVLWEGTHEAAARHVLTTVLSTLRAALPLWPIRATRETLAWDPDAGAEVDLDLFLRWTGLEQEALPPRADPAALRAAIALWRGPFLQGFHLADSEAFEDWLRQQRARWEQRVLLVMARLAQWAEAEGRWDEVTAYAGRALEIDPLQERFHRWRMMGLAAAGSRAAALAHYEACRDLMRQALGTEPHAATRALREQIMAGSYPPPRIAPGGQRPAVPRPRLGPPPEWPLVGREDEMERTCSALARAAQGAGRVVLLHGETGIGKTRLLHEVLDRLRAGAPGMPRFAGVLVGRCHEAVRNIPYAPFVEALQGGLAAADDRAAMPWPEGLVWPDPTVRADLSDKRVFTGSAPGARSVADEGSPAADGPSAAPDLIRLLAALPRPAVLVLDDLHWADDDSLSLFFQLARLPAGRRLCLLVTIRPEDAAAATLDLLRRLQRDGDLQWIDVGPLSETDLRRLVHAATQNRDDALARRLHAETGGNPLFAVEILRALKETPGWVPGTSERLPLPPTVQATVRSRVARLGEPASRLLVAAGIAPAAIPCSMLFYLAQLEEERGVEGLETLLRARLLVEDAGTSFYPGIPGPNVSFSHDVIRRVVREDTSRARWKVLHRRAFAYLAERTDPAEPPPSAAECLAYHATEGDLWEQGLQWCQRAAAVAESLCAYATAAHWLETGQRNLERLPSTRERRRTSVDLHLRLALLGWSTSPTRSVTYVQVAERQAAALGNREHEPDILTRRAEAVLIGGRLSQAAALLDRLLPLARLSRSRRLLATGLLRLAQLRALQGDLRGAVAPFEESAELLERLESHFLYAQSVGTLASTLATLGEFSHARALLQDLQARGERLNHRSTRILAALHQLTVEVLQERWADAAAAGQQLLGLLHDGDHEAYEYIGTLFLGLPLARLGDPRGGIALQQRAIEMASRIGMRILLDRAHAYLAEILLDVGEPEPARQAARQGLRIAREDGYRFGTAFNTRVLGQVALAEGRGDEARRYLAEALRRFDVMGARPEIARCHTLLADAAASAAERDDHRRRARELSCVQGLGTTPAGSCRGAEARACFRAARTRGEERADPVPQG
jgi:DNA-binding SARP family transcriptional activator/tetratricopeptide (TPR) repeat protein